VVGCFGAKLRFKNIEWPNAVFSMKLLEEIFVVLRSKLFVL
jgi:hypothetical protein